MPAFLLNPWVLLGAGLTALLIVGGAYYQGRQDGKAYEALKCETRVASLQAAYAEQAKRIEDLNKAWKDALDIFVDGEAERARKRQEELDDANAKVDEYIAKLSEGKKNCLLDDDDIFGGVQQRTKR